MTRTELLERGLCNLELDVRSKLCETAGLLGVCECKRLARMFPSAPSAGEITQSAKAAAYASALDLIHTTMRELELQYDEPVD